MSDLLQLHQRLSEQFPHSLITLRKADEPHGFQFLNMELTDSEIAVEWKSSLGFSVNKFKKDDNPLDGLFQAGKTWTPSVDNAFNQIMALTTSPSVQNLDSPEGP